MEFKNSKPVIKNFFTNFAAQKSNNVANIPIGMLMGNFRRKKIIETIKNQNFLKKV